MVATIHTTRPTGRPPYRATARHTPIELGPASTYEVITREKLDNLTESVNEIRNRVNHIFYLVIGSLLLDALMGVLP